MKKRALITGLFTLVSLFSFACPVCEKQQPRLLRGITHGAGPQSNWDWLIVGLITAITLLTLVFSVKQLLKPGELNNDHIKHSIIDQN